MTDFKVGDLVRRNTNSPPPRNRAFKDYGVGIILGVVLPQSLEEIATVRTKSPGVKYSVYFSKLEKTLTFYGGYLERVSED